MKILHYALGFPPYRSGGLTKLCVDLMVQQAKEGHTVAMLWPGQMGFVNQKVTIKNHENVKLSGEDILSLEVINPLPVSFDEGIADIAAFTKNVEAEKSIQYALSYSHSDEFIIEDFITQHGYSSDTDSFSIDGELKFISFDCQRFDREAKNPYTPAAYSWPSSMTAEHQEELKNEIQRLLKLLKMRTAVYNIETREGTDGKAYIMELSPRGGGNRLAECLRYATGVDMITNMVKYSVGLPVDEIKQKPYDGCWAEIILHSDEPGVFKELWISDEIAENVVERDLWIEEGTPVGGFEAANEAIGTLVLKFESQERIEEVLGNQSKYVKVKLA